MSTDQVVMGSTPTFHSGLSEIEKANNKRDRERDELMNYLFHPRRLTITNDTKSKHVHVVCVGFSKSLC